MLVIRIDLRVVIKHKPKENCNTAIFLKENFKINSLSLYSEKIKMRGH